MEGQREDEEDRMGVCRALPPCKLREVDFQFFFLLCPHPISQFCPPVLLSFVMWRVLLSYTLSCLSHPVRYCIVLSLSSTVGMV